MDCVALTNLALHVEEDGLAEGPVLVFANSLGTDCRIWDRVVAALKPRLRILRYDKRGHGLSDVGRPGLGGPPYRIEDHVADLEALLEARGIKRAIVCGLSVGGQIALGLAARRPDLVRGLVLSDTAQRIGSAESWNARIAAIQAGGMDSIGDAGMERWFTPEYRRARPAEVALWRNMLVRTPAAGYVGTCAALRDADLTDAARALKLPVLCLCGEQDLATPPDLVRGLANLIPGARFEIIHDAGHLPCIERPDSLSDFVGGFVRSTIGGSALV